MYSNFFTRRWLQFNIRTLLTAMLVASCLMSWVAYMRAQAAKQRKAYQVILDKGGASNFGPDSARSPWLRWILGNDVSGDGGCIEFGDSEFNDADLAQLTSFANLQRLSLSRTHVTDKGLVHMTKLTHLKYLSLDETQISDRGLNFLHACRSLEWLSLYGTKTTSSGVESLQAALRNVNVIDKDEIDWPALNSKK